MQKLFKKNYKKIGILGGTFDPPHKGHLHICRIAIRKFKLDKIIWAVTKKNPFKKNPYLDLKTRIELSKILTKKDKKIFVIYLDKKIKSSNTFNMLYYLKKKNLNKKIFFLMGADNLVKFHKWSNWKNIQKIAKIAVFARNGYSMKSINYSTLKKLDRNNWIYIPSKKVNISSSLIRKFW